MTIRRQWMLVLILSAIICVIINSFILGLLINNYFIDNSKNNYNKHYEQIVEFTRKALLENFTQQQLSAQLETHIVDPIVRIKLYDVNGYLLADVSNEITMMGNHMMNRMMRTPMEEVDSEDISDSGVLLGKLDIVRYSSLANSMQTRMFTVALVRNSILSFCIVIILMLIIGFAISRKMSRDLMNVTEMATNIDLGQDVTIEKSKVQEIRIIQQSLEALQSKLKLKQVSRKRLLDELVHQTRTPLTILKTNLEGFEDGVLDMSSKEIETCKAQIDNITSIIVNMSAMIDAEKNLESIQLEDVEMNQLLKLIIGSLKVQFSKKQIDLSLQSNKKIVIKSDKYKLSQCIYNILTNAYKFTEPNGKVLVSYELIEEELKIVIEDTGIGIRSEDMKNLFNAYFRGINVSNISGEGIGLYVVKENLSMLNGEIHVESELNKGSRFIITLPCDGPPLENSKDLPNSKY